MRIPSISSTSLIIYQQITNARTDAFVYLFTPTLAQITNKILFMLQPDLCKIHLTLNASSVLRGGRIKVKTNMRSRLWCASYPSNFLGLTSVVPVLKLSDRQPSQNSARLLTGPLSPGLEEKAD